MIRIIPVIQDMQKRKDNELGLVSMHRQILDPDRNIQIDHIDGNGLNNQKYNLRLATNKQNSYNRPSYKGSSKYKGVCWHKPSQKWLVQIQADGKLHYLGTYYSEEVAGRVYDEAAKEYHGEFARLNFPD